MCPVEASLALYCPSKGFAESDAGRILYLVEAILAGWKCSVYDPISNINDHDATLRPVLPKICFHISCYALRHAACKNSLRLLAHAITRDVDLQDRSIARHGFFSSNAAPHGKDIRTLPSAATGYLSQQRPVKSSPSKP